MAYSDVKQDVSLRTGVHFATSPIGDVKATINYREHSDGKPYVSVSLSLDYHYNGVDLYLTPEQYESLRSQLVPVETLKNGETKADSQKA